MRPVDIAMTAEEARSIFSYNPDTGEIIRVKSDKRFAGKVAGVVHHGGYRVIKINYRQILAHRLAWLLHHGEWPGDLFIDHINHDKTDNRICNLRKATNTQNLVNTKKCWNKHGLKGVQYSHRINKGKRWFATISERGHEKYLGSYHTAEEAGAAFRKAAIEIHGEFANVEVSR